MGDRLTSRDPVLSLDFSLKAIFTWQDYLDQMLSNAEQEDIQRLFSCISPVHKQPVISASGEHQHNYTSWYWNDTALMESCISGKLFTLEDSMLSWTSFNYL